MMFPDDDQSPRSSLPQHVDIRRREMDPVSAPASVDICTHQIELRIEAVHQRLLARATRGRLRWEGDRIVRAGRRHCRPGGGDDPARHEAAPLAVAAADCPASTQVCPEPMIEPAPQSMPAAAVLTL